MFEVGKKYSYHSKGPVATCLFSDDETTVMRYDWNSHPLASSTSYFIREGWKEYVEPKVVKEVLYVKIFNDVIYTTMRSDSNGGAKVIGKICITHTEDHGTKIEILEGEDTSK